ncbi:hypothetical protein CTN02_15660 [Lysinibacillus sphaericus]|nr:hypothetical protein CTN02_15660 [Lysinibacillus sphaericus]
MAKEELITCFRHTRTSERVYFVVVILFAYFRTLLIKLDNINLHCFFANFPGVKKFIIFILICNFIFTNKKATLYY